MLTRAKKILFASAGVTALACRLAIGVGHAPAVRAQPPAPPQFAVASIKLSNPSAPRGGRLAAPPIETTPGLLTARNASLKQLIKGAYAIEDYQVSGGPGWIDAARFDVVAKSSGPAHRDQLLLMLRDLLADRFKLAFHRETKDLVVDALVVAKNGPKFHAAKAGADPAPGKIDRMRWKDLPSLAAYLTRLSTDKPVIDKTGLTGEFDLELDMARVVREASQSGGGEHTTLESMFQATANALQDELGLKLVPTKAPIAILVIDHAERASVN